MPVKFICIIAFHRAVPTVHYLFKNGTSMKIFTQQTCCFILHKQECYNIQTAASKKCEVRINQQWCIIHTELHKKSIQRLKVEMHLAKDTYTNFTVIFGGHFTPFFTKEKYAKKEDHVKTFSH
jgi:hypothetical protein